MKKSYVYILECADGSFYTGVTNNVYRRFEEHRKGKDSKSYTYHRRPLYLVFYASFTSVETAIDREKQIKKWSRVKKEALINNEYEKLPNLAKKHFDKNN